MSDTADFSETPSAIESPAEPAKDRKAKAESNVHDRNKCIEISPENN